MRTREALRWASGWFTRWTRTWQFLLIGCLVTLSVTDALTLRVATSLFTSGYNNIALGGFGEIPAYFLASAIMDLALILTLWALLIPALHLLRAKRLQAFCLAGVCALVVPFSLVLARYKIHSVMGDLATLGQLQEVSAGSWQVMLAGALTNLPGTELLIAVLVAVAVLPMLVVAWRIEKRIDGADERFRPPRVRWLWAGAAVAATVGILVLVTPWEPAMRLRQGLVRKPSTTLLIRIFEPLTDVDRDGYGLLSRPPDNAPFNSSIHPNALDVPGNGVDENGLAGDHPSGFLPVAVVREPGFRGDAKPHVLMIFLESFRADLIGQELRGREITPFLNRLAAEGASSAAAFAHSPYTIPSRAQLFSGQLVARPGESTLIDDFKERGYFVAHYSGQDESYGESEALLGVERADVFYDARRDRDRRTSRSTQPASLQIGWKLLDQRVREFLATNDLAQPLFLYVNVVDSHYPYFHSLNDEIDPILDVETITRDTIRPKNARKVWEAYANTVANVDRAVERTVAAFREHIGDTDHAILITADHGQAFYENGYLGHGRWLDEAQTRVPFILWGVGGDWPEPLGLADVRGLLRRTLSVERGDGVPRARFVPKPRRSILQYVGSVSGGHVLGLRRLQQTVIYDVRSRRLALIGPGDTPLRASRAAKGAEFRALIWNWEALQLREAAARH
jgi:hypothetical protein